MTTYSYLLDGIDETIRVTERASVPATWHKVAGMRWVVMFWQYRILNRAKKNVRRVQKVVLSLSGVAHMLPKLSTDQVASEAAHLIKVTSSLQDEYLEMRRDVLALRSELQAIGMLSPDLQRVLGDWIAAYADCYEVAQDICWTVREVQAQQDIDTGRVERFSTAEAAIAALRA